MLENTIIFDSQNINSQYLSSRHISMFNSSMASTDNTLNGVSFNDDSFHSINSEVFFENELNIADLKTDKYNQHLTRRISSIDFSKILLNLLIDLVDDENLSVLDVSSTSIQCLLFGLEKLVLLSRQQIELVDGSNEATGENPIFENIDDCDIIVEKLLILVLNCLNNVFKSKRSLTDLIDVNSIVRQLLIVLQNGLERDCKLKECDSSSLLRCDICFGIYYYLHIFINNTYLLKIDDELIKIFNTIMENLQRHTDRIYEIIKKSSKSELIYKKMSMLFLKIIRNFKLMEEGLIEQRGRKGQKKFIRNQQSRHHHTKKCKINLKCVVEHNLFRLISHLTHDKVRKILKFFQTTNSFCCCNTNIELLATLFDIIKKHPRLVRPVLSFLKHNYISLLVNPNCEHCSSRINSMKFQCQLVRHYMEIIDIVFEFEYCIILNHVSKLPKSQPAALARKIMFDVTFPIFETYKMEILLFENDPKFEEQLKLAKSIVYSCLNNFANYLINFNQLVPEFFTETIVQHLDDLMVHYEIVPNIFRLIKIGLYNNYQSTCSNIYRKIIKMPIGTTLMVTNKLLILFHRLAEKHEYFNIKKLDQKLITTCTNDQSSHPLIFELRLAAVYWNMTLQLLQSNAQFKAEFREEFFKQHENETLITIIYNTLYCIIKINHPNMNSSTLSNHKTDIRELPEFIILKPINNFIDNVDLYETMNINMPKSALLQPYDESISYEIDVYQHLDHKQFHHHHDDIEDFETFKLIYDVSNVKSNCIIKKVDEYYRQFITISRIGDNVYLKNNECSSGIVRKEEDNENNSDSVFNRFISWLYPFHKNDNSVDQFEIVDDELNVLRTTECRKILFQLFEITLSVYLLDLPGSLFGKLDFDFICI